jgi:hypothetical protein
MQTLHDISFLIQEYQNIIPDNDDIDREFLKEQLVQEADWTYRGAETLVHLAERYGSSVLRNALALSLVLGIEDGDSGL